jgi:hypothetical protein
MKTTLQATLIAICACGMATAQAETTVYSPTDVPSDYGSLGNTDAPADVIGRLPPSEAAKAVVYNGQVYLPKSDIRATGVAAGSTEAAGAAAAGSTAILVAVGVGVFAVIGAVVAGSSSNGTTATTTTSTHK